MCKIAGWIITYLYLGFMFVCCANVNPNLNPKMFGEIADGIQSTQIPIQSVYRVQAMDKKARLANLVALY